MRRSWGVTGWSIISRLSILGFHGPKSDMSEQIRCFLEAPRVDNSSDIVLFVRGPVRGPSEMFLFLDPYFKISNFEPQKSFHEIAYCLLFQIEINKITTPSCNNDHKLITCLGTDKTV